MEAELVAIADTMGQILWTHHFLAAQGQYVLPLPCTKISRVQSYWQRTVSLPATKGCVTWT